MQAYQTKTRKIFRFDTTCVKYGLKSGDLIVTPRGLSIFVGFLPDDYFDQLNLWALLDEDDGVSFWRGEDNWIFKNKWEWNKENLSGKGLYKLNCEVPIFLDHENHILMLNQSKEVCEPFGFLPGNTVETPSGDAEVIGVEVRADSSDMYFKLKKPTGEFKPLFLQGLENIKDGRGLFCWKGYRKEDFLLNGIRLKELPTLFQSCRKIISQSFRKKNFRIKTSSWNPFTLDLLENLLKENLLITPQISRPGFFKSLNSELQSFFLKHCRKELTDLFGLRPNQSLEKCLGYKRCWRIKN